jgi:TonB family protein
MALASTKTREMLRPLHAIFLICSLISNVAALPIRAQEPTPAAPPPVAATQPAHFDYSDNVRGLEHLAKDIMNAQKEGHEARAMELAQSMILPDPGNWYLQNFGPDIANDEGAKYASDRKNLSPEILKFFFGAIQNHFTDVTVARFGDSCDDNAGESAFGTLQLRLQPVPLYELRLRNGDRFLRLFALVYVDGGFRYALAPRVPDHFPFVPRKPAGSATDPGTIQAKQIRVGGPVLAARIVSRVQPEYPETARNEHLQGSVRLHAIIARDGSISRLVVLRGYCSLAKAAVKAVGQWRYSPTLLNGEPVEVDTTIDVIFSLSH